MILFILSSLLLIFSFDVSAIESPIVLIHQKTSLGLVKEVVPVRGKFIIDGNVEEIHFTCWSPYPNKWIMIPSPHVSGSNVKEFLIDKGRHVFRMENGDSKFWSLVILRFTNNPNRILHQTAACQHHDYENNKVNVIVKISSRDGDLEGALFINDTLKRSRGERYGRNKNCGLVMYLDPKLKRMTCTHLDGIKTTQPDFIKCSSPEECDASIQKVDVGCAEKEEYTPVVITSHCTNCTSIGTKSGALICDYEGGGRQFSLAQIVFFTLDQKPFFHALSKTSPKIATRLRMDVVGKSKLDHVYNGTTVTFQCSGVLWYFSEGFQWAIQDVDGNLEYLGNIRMILLCSCPDGTRVNMTPQWKGEDLATEDRKAYVSTKNITFPSMAEKVNVVCMAPLLNSYEWENVSLKVVVRESKIPQILNVTAVVREGGGLKIHCIATGEPLPYISWKRNGAPLPSEMWRTSFRNKTFENSVLSIDGNDGGVSEDEFACEVTNKFKQTLLHSIHTQVGARDTSNLRVVVGIPILILVVLLLILVAYLYWKIRNKDREIQKLTEDEIHEFTHGDPESGNSALFYPYNTDFEIPKSKIQFESKVLGDGQFGRVTRGKIGKGYVAIKTVKKFADISYLKALLSELKICCYVGQHENIVNLIGGCTQNIHKREVYLIYEYCANGNVLKYLRKYRDQFVNHLSNGKYTPSRESIIDYQNISVKKISSKDLLRWAAEIASGMEFLGNKNILHGDLAARNILLTEALQAKVGDFGLSKQLYDYSVYVQKLECPLPLKWMAVESLRDLQFSIKSDVWSYGVTLWEIYSLAQPPYPGIPQFDSSSWKMLLEGYRMEKPPYASDQVYNVMLRCWELEPDSRPSFSTLKNIFDELLIHLRGQTSLKIY